VLFSIYKIGVTFIKLDICSSLEETDGHVLQNVIMHTNCIYLFLFICILYLKLIE
jgi:hypothetical protein